MRPFQHIPRIFPLLLHLLLLLPTPTHSAPTDSPHDADIPQSSYLGGTHAISPSHLPSFTHLWNASFAANEKHWARPLLYTLPDTGRQIVFTASTENRIRTFDAVTGELLKERQVAPAWPTEMAFCEQVGRTVGIVGTPVVYVEEGVVFFYVKSYIEVPGGAAPPLNAVTYLYGVYLDTLLDLYKFPLFIDDVPADNDSRKMFLGGLVLQRPALLLLGEVLYAGFGGMCDAFNYTGSLVAVNLATRKTYRWTTQAGPTSSYTPDWTSWHGGGAGGIWQAGMGLSSNGQDVFFTIDNGSGSQSPNTSTTPKPGTQYEGVLSETVVRIRLDEGSGTGEAAKGIQLVDFFRPFDYQTDAGQDIGSGSFALLDPSTFSTPQVAQIGIATSTNTKLYVLDAGNLGGYRMGPNGTDAALQVIQLPGEVFGGVGSYPLEGGWVYVNMGNGPLSAYRFNAGAGEGGNASTSSSGSELFTLAGVAPFNNPHYNFVGVPTVTSDEGKEGTGIVWVTDVDKGLLAYKAVPENGSLIPLPLPKVEGAVKYSRPVFGDGRVYMFDGVGRLVAMGVK
ncbi:hypothetical protein LEMA_P041430.1 [Plenodomus lingam JN3]|uniref:Pyrrolo-quinoline quinone n=1 Tax=Leptosphaeria maculans (strain JN3 / isolate v23.1.3 / race Av1-4-5-6-7-8) TaxID=985895 RepID=E4ZNM3_LEPMJ|nr:hypothetical protein LEMA_P041430.1 [Plenodomus lingam JN3]CBX93242.1 hypothetical protein LEMA_P041430.1 [Plenodomus lingam JN3]